MNALKRIVFVTSALLLITGLAVAAQTVLAQFKVTEAQARDTILEELNSGVGGHMNRPVVDLARKAYKAIPASARGAATTALYNWTKVGIAKHLRAFVDATPDVDFAAKQKVVQGEGGSGLAFVNAAYSKKPWQWRLAYEFGPEAIAAARTAAQAWLKELGK